MSHNGCKEISTLAQTPDLHTKYQILWQISAVSTLLSINVYLKFVHIEWIYAGGYNSFWLGSHSLLRLHVSSKCREHRVKTMHTEKASQRQAGFTYSRGKETATRWRIGSCRNGCGPCRLHYVCRNEIKIPSSFQLPCPLELPRQRQRVEGGSFSHFSRRVILNAQKCVFSCNCEDAAVRPFVIQVFVLHRRHSLFRTVFKLNVKAFW